MAGPLKDLAPPEEWRALPADSSPFAAVTLAEQQTRLWALTLEAREIPYRVEADGNGWQILVPPEVFAVAAAELQTFEEKNLNWPPPLPPAPPEADNLLITLSVLVLIAIFHNLTQLNLDFFNLSTADWISRGNADAGAIMAGQWWRAVTALTLHADGLHLLGNLTVGGFFIVFLCRTLGSGLGWSLLLASGTLGNLLNAWVQSPRHHSVGASTTVFGAVGLLAAINLLYHRQNLRRRWYLPLAAALALLALLGSEGENTDLGAHLFGFAVGIGLGLATGFLRHGKGRPGAAVNALLALACLGLVSGAWWAALHFS
jgi:membrane associated rhomboid family serine protease